MFTILQIIGLTMLLSIPVTLIIFLASIVFKEDGLKALLAWVIMPLSYVIIALILLIVPVISQAYNPNDKVLLKTSSTCHFCEESKHLLGAAHIRYTEQAATFGAVPQLYINGQLVGYGTEVVKDYINEKYQAKKRIP